MARIGPVTRADLLTAGLAVAMGLLCVGVWLAISPTGDGPVRTRPATAVLSPSGRPSGWTSGWPSGWQEIEWPYAVDPWWPSKAFRCAAATCGGEVTLLLRAKLGFCNCDTGVADDAELERISDFALMSASHTPAAAGRAVAVAGLKGRSRPFTMQSQTLPGGSVLLFGLNDRCDAIVATAATHDLPADKLERAVTDFLDSAPVRTWTEKTLGL